MEEGLADGELPVAESSMMTIPLTGCRTVIEPCCYRRERPFRADRETHPQIVSPCGSQHGNLASLALGKPLGRESAVWNEAGGPHV